MIKLTLKLKNLLKDNQTLKEEKIEEIEGVKSSLNLKKITKIMMKLILMNIQIIKEIKIKTEIMLEGRTNSINKKATITKMMIFSNKEMKKEKCLRMNKKFLIKTSFKLVKIKPKKVKEPIKAKKWQCWDQQALQLEEVLILKMKKDKELKKSKLLKIICQQEMPTKHQFNTILEIS